jgi:formate-dependent nitrite reductase cytochrome c552 subunit
VSLNKLLILVIAAAVSTVLIVSGAFSGEKPSYVGAVKCKPCHNTTKSGKQYSIWAESPHAKAYETLLSDHSQKVAKEMDIADPAKSETCLKCHVTAYLAPAEQKAETYTMEEGVSCEACHGPGELYKSVKVMKSRELALENGMILPDEALCKGCHNPESPTYKEFKFAEAVKQIAHPTPKE